MRFCCTLSSDAAFFHQATASIETLRQAASHLASHQVDVAFIAINLRPEQLDWLRQHDVQVHMRLEDFPRFKDAPDHAYALTCRPYLPWIWPDYDGHLWVDSDIRFLSHHGLAFYLEALADPIVSIVAAQENDPAYGIQADPTLSRAYHLQRGHRLQRVYGDAIMQYCQYFAQFNAGLFAARADSPLWARFRRNLGKALAVPYSDAAEPGDQDALNISLLEVGNWRCAPSVVNWLCSLRMPLQAEDGTWRHPDEPFRQVLVAHLTNSSDPVMSGEGLTTYYECYRTAGLTA